jgi:uncharacterized protein involved in outer membrane biogenesis
VRRRVLIVGAIVVATPIVLVGAAMLYLKFADLSGYRGTVERRVSDALGRELRIAGDFAPEVGLTTRLVATDVSLANPPWASEPAMAAVDRLDVTVELLPLLLGRVRIPKLVVDGARVSLETDTEGRSNWTFTTHHVNRHPHILQTIEAGTVELNDLAVTYHAPSLPRTLDLEAARLAATGDAAGALAVRLSGILNGEPLVLAGRLGPLGTIISGGRIEHALDGHLGGVALATSGAVEDLRTLAGADVTLAAHGPDAAEITDTFGLPSLGTGAFDVTAKLTPSARGTALSLSADLGQVTAEANGEVDSLKAPGRGVATVSAAGPDLAATGALVGLDHLPAATFELSCRVAWDGFPVTIDSCEVRVGDNRLTADGTLGAPPRLLATDLRFEGSGPDLAAIGRPGRFQLPGGGFSLRGRIVSVDNGIGLDGIELRASGATATVNGTLGSPPGLSGTELTVHTAGPDLSAFSGLAGLTLPATDFEVEGRLRPVDGTVELDPVTARVGSDRATVEGKVVSATGLVGSELHVTAEGADASRLAAMLGVAKAPAEPYRVEGRVRVLDGSVLLRDLTVQAGDLSVTAAGTLGPIRSPTGTDLHVHVEGSDASWPAAAVGVTGVPAEPLRIDGHIQVRDDGYQLDGVEARIGAATLSASGRLGQLPELAGTELDLVVDIPSLSAFDALVPQATLPPAPASLSGHVVLDGAAVRLQGVVVDIDGTTISADGTLATAAGWIGTGLSLRITSPDVGAAGRLLAGTGLVALPELPAAPFSLTGRVAVDEAGSRVDGVRVTFGGATGALDGRIGWPPDFRGTDLSLTADGPSAALLATLTGAAVPAAPFNVGGRFGRIDTGFRFDSVRIQLGEYQVLMTGTLGEPPRFEGTELELDASGPSLSLVADLAGLRGLPDLPFEVEGRFDGNPLRFKSDRIVARLGGSDVTGSFRIGLGGERPRLNGQLASRRVDPSEILGHGDEQPTTGKELVRDGAGVDGDGLVFSTAPISWDALLKVDGQLRWTVEALDLRTVTFADVDVGVQLEGGVLHVDPLHAVGAVGGRLDGQVDLDARNTEPALRTTIRLSGVPVDLTAAEESPAEWPTLGLDLELRAAGRSTHELASSADGRIALTLGPGPVDSSVLDRLTADLVLEVFQLLNPFSEKHQARLDCGVIVIDLVGGLATLDPFAIQTDHTTVVGDGTVDLSSEKLDLHWVTKPRKGIGVSASTITNAYLKLGGTLAHPKIETKPLNALASTGLAVATGGLSLLGKGLFDRISAEKDICEKALARAKEN